MRQYRLKDEDLRLWSHVTATVRPHTRRSSLIPPQTADPDATAPSQPEPPNLKTLPAAPMRLSAFELGGKAGPEPLWRLGTDHDPRLPEGIEPNRKRRISRERDPIEARLDLHGLDQIRARDRLISFVTEAHHLGLRAVLVITGKGVTRGGVLKRLAPAWLAEPSLSGIVAGISPAHARHGGEGALYVALKRRA